MHCLIKINVSIPYTDSRINALGMEAKNKPLSLSNFNEIHALKSRLSYGYRCQGRVYLSRHVFQYYTVMINRTIKPAALEDNIASEKYPSRWG